MGDVQGSEFSFWNGLWQEKFHARVQRIRANPQVDYWDKRARDFSAMRKSNDYDYGKRVYAALQSVLNADTTVLDIGAGPGSFVVPFAKRVKFVTAIEPSREMAALLRENADEAGIGNYAVIEKMLQDFPSDSALNDAFDLVTVSLVFWMYEDVWPLILQMESYSNRYCAIVAEIPDKKNPRASSRGDVEEFQILYNMLVAQGRFANVRVIDYRCERSVEDEAQYRSIAFEQYEGDITPQVMQRIRDEVQAEAKNGMCTVATRSAVIWWDKRDLVP